MDYLDQREVQGLTPEGRCKDNRTYSSAWTTWMKDVWVSKDSLQKVGTKIRECTAVSRLPEGDRCEGPFLRSEFCRDSIQKVCTMVENLQQYKVFMDERGLEVQGHTPEACCEIRLSEQERYAHQIREC